MAAHVPVFEGMLDVFVVIALLGFVVARAVLGALWTGIRTGRRSPRQGRPEPRQGIWVTTCPLVHEPALLLVENDRLKECSVGGPSCGASCQQKTATARSGIFDTSKLLNLNYKADSARFQC